MAQGTDVISISLIIKLLVGSCPTSPHVCCQSSTSRYLPVPGRSRVCWWCCIPSVMVEVRYIGADRAAGSRGILVQARVGHLRTDIQDFQSQLPGGRICRFIVVR